MSAVAPKPLRGVRIGLADYFLNEVHPEVARVTMEALRKLESAGAELVRADVSKEIRVGTDLTRTVHLYETAANMSAFLTAARVGHHLRGSCIPGEPGHSVALSRPHRSRCTKRG